MSHGARAPRWSSGPMTQSQVHHGRISAEDAQLRHGSQCGYFFLVASADGILRRRRCQSCTFSRVVLELRKQRVPKRQQLALCSFAYTSLSSRFFFSLLKHNSANTARVLCTPQLTHVALIGSLDWDSADAASHMHSLRFAGPQITFIL